MGYYTRAFCKSENVPNLKEVLDWVNAQGSPIRPLQDTALDSSAWSQLEVEYKKGKSPIILEVNRDDGTSECLVRQEIQEFATAIGKPGFSLAKRKVIQHLRHTKFIVAIQLPTHDIDDDGYTVNGYILQYFVLHCQAITQADREGFYIGNKLVIKE
ncbi:hypothetical protein A3F52_05025 [Candidatus Uhrbacteria bacterium RIFCSPHIGHO2_12_FULL_47_11]|nr:MAG: hypothetical protein A2753_04925 [Candidatus Uhrbacteria bacterium RIFCSPHIGHO2_01_FULL_47_11]OGL76504.1 MAG: hypothetical protein A3F52_05025 [Candidatus Uhrbacteria bacterium RIFCSPHIGHO2_12_FULL_47_11]